jgi:hypothetical protein
VRQATLQGGVYGAVWKHDVEGFDILRAVTLGTGKVDELVDDILTSVHVIRVFEYFGQLESSLKVVIQGPGALLLIEFDETLPCLRVGAKIRRRLVSSLGKINLAFLVECKGLEDIA